MHHAIVVQDAMKTSLVRRGAFKLNDKKGDGELGGLPKIRGIAPTRGLQGSGHADSERRDEIAAHQEVSQSRCASSLDGRAQRTKVSAYGGDRTGCTCRRKSTGGGY